MFEISESFLACYLYQISGKPSRPGPRWSLGQSGKLLPVIVRLRLSVGQVQIPASKLGRILNSTVHCSCDYPPRTLLAEILE